MFDGDIAIWQCQPRQYSFWIETVNITNIMKFYAKDLRDFTVQFLQIQV